jgi:hypothetical protein
MQQNMKKRQGWWILKGDESFCEAHGLLTSYYTTYTFLATVHISPWHITEFMKQHTLQYNTAYNTFLDSHCCAVFTWTGRWRVYSCFECGTNHASLTSCWMFIILNLEKSPLIPDLGPHSQCHWFLLNHSLNLRFPTSCVMFMCFGRYVLSTV